MAAYVVMERPEAGRDGAVFVRDGFTVIGFLLPFFWLLWQRLWIEGALAIGAALLLAAVEGAGAFFAVAAPVVSILVSIYVGLEGSALRIAALRRRGYVDRGVIEADSIGDAEIRYFAGLRPLGSDTIVPMAAGTALALPRPAVNGPALGLLAYPGSR
jgi:hypothetical protein